LKIKYALRFVLAGPKANIKRQAGPTTNLHKLSTEQKLENWQRVGI